MLRRCFAVGVALGAVVLASCMQRGVPEALVAKRVAVVDAYHGVKVVDEYRWLENWDDPQVKAWSAAENQHTRAYFDHLADRPAIKARLRQMITSSSTAYFGLNFRGGQLFERKVQPPMQQPLLVALRSADDLTGEKIVFDPNQSRKEGSLAVDFYVPSLDGKYVAAAMSENGSEDAAVHVFETGTGKELPDRVPRVNFATAGGSLDWNADGSGFYYTRYPQGNERPPEDANFYQQIYFHKLGTDARQDVYVLGKDFPRIAEIGLHTSDDGKWLIARVANGDGGEYAHFVMNAAGKWTQVTRFEDKVVGAAVGPDDGLYLISHKDAPRGKVLRLPLADLRLDAARVVVPESPATGAGELVNATVEDIAPTEGRLYVTYMAGGPEKLVVYDLMGRQLAGPAMPPVSSAGGVVRLKGGDVLYQMESYLEPSAWYSWSAASGQAHRTALFETAPYDYKDVEVLREFATSKDGTKVPVNILRRKGTVLDGKNPTLLYGYGGYGVSMSPGFAGAGTRMWLDHGGVYVVANIRGGGEYGEEWHKAGNLTNKQHVFDDFLAAAQYLIDQHYTAPAHLAIRGGSNGGLLMGAALTQRPDMFRAVVSQVGIYDMLRVELDPNGEFNTTEFGTVKDAAQFKALYAYSPYHHITNGTAYPAILFSTGENDHRVNPMQSRKMTARLQAATSSGRPIFLRTTASAGHGVGTALDERIEESADMYSFLFDQLGMKFTPAAK